MLRRLAAIALAAALATVPGLGCGSQPAPSIRIVGWDVLGSSVILTVRITGWRMAPPEQGRAPRPRTGQWQIFAGDRYVGFSFDPRYGVINGLSVGTYGVWVALARSDYSLVYPLIRSQTVRVTITSATGVDERTFAR